MNYWAGRYTHVYVHACVLFTFEVLQLVCICARSKVAVHNINSGPKRTRICAGKVNVDFKSKHIYSMYTHTILTQVGMFYSVRIMCVWKHATNKKAELPIPSEPALDVKLLPREHTYYAQPHKIETVK